MPAPPVRALVFDVFGTLVDWRGSLVRAFERFGAERGIACDFGALVDAWRGAYLPSLDRVRSGARPWAILDVLHAESLDVLIQQFALEGLDARDRQWMVAQWHALDPWPDVKGGLERLRARHVLATLSNGNVSLLVDLARYGDLRFDAILSAELFRHYKPDPETYLGACTLLGCAPAEVMMVAAHPSDLRAAAACGLRTALVVRLDEYGPARRNNPPLDAAADLTACDLDELADAY